LPEGFCSTAIRQGTPPPRWYSERRGVLLDRDQAGHAAAALVFRAHRVAGALGRDHEDVQVAARLDQVEVDVEAVSKGDRRAVLHVGRQVIPVEPGLKLVGGEHHDHVGPAGRLGRGHDLETGGFRLPGGGRAGAERHAHVGGAAVLEVVGVGVTLAAVADHGDLLALDEIHIGVTVVIDAHGGCPPFR
jgi:hypothetical protein